ncbi:unnamed protein product [Musa hybrid cultivar]
MGKDCDHHHHSSCCGCSVCSDHSTLLTIAWVVGAFVLVVLLVVFITWLVLRPTKPIFYLKDATVYQFNLSLSDNILSTVLQATVSSHNPNSRIGVSYDRASVYVTYQNQQITLPTSIPPLYQGHHDINVWSPYLYGASVPVAPSICGSLQQDEAAGYLLLYLKIDGMVRWKVGTWTSGHYHLEVTCPAFFSVDSTSNGVAVVRFQRMSPCSVSV